MPEQRKCRSYGKMITASLSKMGVIAKHQRYMLLKQSRFPDRVPGMICLCLRHFLVAGTFLLFFIALLGADLYVFTEEGHIAYSVDQGATWAWRSGTTPYAMVVDIAQDTAGNIYALSETGEVMRSADGCQTWMTLSTVSTVGCKSIWVLGNGEVFVMTRQGDVARSTDGGATFIWMGSTGASCMVDLIAHEGIFAFTYSGDVYRSDDLGASWAPIGTIDQMGVIGATPTTNSLFALTERGDLAESADMGVTWDLVSTTSQIGMTGITNVNDTLYVTTQEGDVASSDDGSVWDWEGSASQVYIGGIGSDEMSILAIEEIAVTYEICPEGIRLQFTLHSDVHTVISWHLDRKEGAGERAALAVVSGEKHGYLDMEVEENITYAYWITARFDDGGEKEVGPFIITYPGYSPIGLQLHTPFPHPVRDQCSLVISSAEETWAQLVLTDVTGRVICRLWSGMLRRGHNRLHIDIPQDENKISFMQVVAGKARSNFQKVVVFK